MANHRLLVTGLRGFVGSALVARVAQRPDAADITLSGLVERTGEAVDIRNADAVQRAVTAFAPTALIHLAAVASPRDAAGDPGAAWSVNVIGTFNLAHALRKHESHARFIFAGSSESYGASFASATQPLREDTLLQPTTVYGATKAAADLMLGQMERDGLAAVRFRPFNHTGSGQAAAYVVSAFARQIVCIERGWQEPVITVGNLDAQRDFLDVRDVVDAYLRAALNTEAPATGAFNLATGAPIAIATILHTLLGEAERTIDIKQDPQLMRASELPVVSGDTAKTQAVFGWAPVIPLAQTLRDVLDHWRAVADSAPEMLR